MRHCPGGWWVVVGAILLGHAQLSSAQGPCEPWAGRLVSTQGQVEHKRSPSSGWLPSTPDSVYCPGDSLRVGSNSRAAVLLPSETIVRLDQRSTMTFSAPEDEGTSLVDLIEGIGYFLSRVPRRLKVTTPFVNAAVEGTEFLAQAALRESRVLVYEGVVSAENPLGRLLLESGEGAVAGPGQAPRKVLIAKPRDAVEWALYYPPVVHYPAGEALPEVRDALDRGDSTAALAALERIPARQRDARFHALRASILLNVGQVEPAQQDLARALEIDPAEGNAIALKAIIALVLDRPEKAMSRAEEGARLAPTAAAPQVALSYVHQSRFDLDQAWESARAATELEPDNALAWARRAELDLARGNLDAAMAAAAQSTGLNPDLARTRTTLGFAQLLRFDAADATASFERAIELDQADPLPRLGLGIARIRQGQRAQGRREIEIAATLDPGSSILRSYLGKAYYDEKRDDLAASQYGLAKTLDPKDPTPWFYDAIRNQTGNRPVEALEDLQQSVDRNENRAVYRSSLLLDSDLAARSASLARIYGDLGFERRALVEGWNSVNADPGNWSAHRLLADTYAEQSRQNVARVSELFQALMYQPINTLPLQPQEQESSLPIVARSGPTDVAFNEFHPLFASDGPNLQFDGALGNNSTWGNNLVAYGTHQRLSYSFGQFHYETDGFRENNDQREDIYNAFIQVAVNPRLSIQAELRRRESEQGDLEMRFDPELFSRTLRRTVDQDLGRIGLKFAPDLQSTLLASVLYVDREGERTDSPVGQPAIAEDIQTDGYQSELQYLYQGDRLNLIAGGAWYTLNRDERFDFDWTSVFGLACPPSPPFPPVPCQLSSSVEPEHRAGYVYLNLAYPTPVIWTLGLSYDDIDEQPLETRRTNPKLGLQWDATDSLRFRGAYFETVKRSVIVEQTLEPTQVAGFTQFFDDLNGTEARTRGVGLDWKLPRQVFLGAEAVHRDVREPFFTGDEVAFSEREIDTFQGYLYWTPHKQWALSATYSYEDVDSDGLFFGVPEKVRTESVPLKVRYFGPIGIFGELGATWVDQTVRYPSFDQVSAVEESEQNSFWVVDAVIGYRLPKRLGILSLEVRNLFNQDFFYQDDNYRTSEPVAPRFIPDRTIVGKLSLSF